MTYVLSHRYPCGWVSPFGHLRIKACLPAPRSFSQATTSFIAQEIRQRIFQQTGLTASAGISVNKFIAKIASDYRKPNGQTTIIEAEVQDFLDRLDVRKFYGIGKVTAEKMYQLGIFKGKDLREKSLEFLERNFGNSGHYYY